jgi:hypothetical protein
MEITNAKTLPGYRLELHLDNGESGVVDLSEYVGRGVFVRGSGLESLNNSG